MTKLFETPADLGEYLFRVTDNGGSSFDRYTVTFSDGTYLGLSGSPAHPQGFSQAGEGIDVAFQSEAVEQGREIDLALGDLPEGLVDHILMRCNEGFADFLQAVERLEPDSVAKNRDAAKVHEGLSSSLGDGIYVTETGFRVRFDGGVKDDPGPFKTAREAVLATLPDAHGFAGPEYHSTVDDLLRMEPDPSIQAAIAALEEKVADEHTASPRSGGI